MYIKRNKRDYVYFYFSNCDFSELINKTFYVVMYKYKYIYIRLKKPQTNKIIFCIKGCAVT